MTRELDELRKRLAAGREQVGRQQEELDKLFKRLDQLSEELRKKS